MASTPHAGQSGIRPAGEIEAGEIEAGETEAGETEAGETEAGETEAGETEAGEIEAGETETGDGGDSAPAGRPATTAPTLDDIGALARQALATIPPELRRMVGDLLFCVADFPDDDTVAALALDSPFDLLGLYHGIDLSVRSVGDPPQDVNHVLLYRRPILDYWCESGEELGHLVRHVLIHEIGHHFGLSDADMDRIEQEMLP